MIDLKEFLLLILCFPFQPQYLKEDFLWTIGTGLFHASLIILHLNIRINIKINKIRSAILGSSFNEFELL
jgi:hypothetical protein